MASHVDVPPSTALSFFRKKQTIHSLETERPQSLKSFYTAVLAAVREIEQRIEMKQEYFYGKNRTCQETLKEYLFDVTMVVTKLVLPSIYSTKQVEDVVHMAQDPNATHQVDLVHVDNMKLGIKKILSAVKTDFVDLKKDLEVLVSFVTKYCVTFCDSKTAAKINNETIIGYQRLIEQAIETIEKNSEIFPQLVMKFETTGLYLEDFSLDMRDLAIECGCIHSVYLLLYEIACRSLQNSCDIVRKWIKADTTYLKDIKLDIMDLECETNIKEKELRSLQDIGFQMDFKVKHAKKELMDLVDESDRLQAKECAITNLEHTLQETKRQLEMDLELKIMRRGMLQDNAKELTSREYAEKSDRLQDETMAVKEQLSATNRKLEEIKAKTKWLKSRNKLKLEKKKNLDDVKKKLKSARKNMARIESVFNKQKNCLRIMKTVYVQKTSTDALRKIFHNMPLQRSHVHQTTYNTQGVVDQDDVGRVIKIVSYKIGNDWMKLYYILPFFPYRGEENMVADLTEIIQANLRANAQTKAKHALLKWRRLHTRASVGDLKKALQTIKRDDVIAVSERSGGKAADVKGKQLSSNHAPIHLPRLAVLIDDEGNSMIQIQ